MLKIWSKNMDKIELGKFAYEEALKIGAGGPLMQDTSEAGKQRAYEVLGEIFQESQEQIKESKDTIYLGVYLLYSALGVCKETDVIIQSVIRAARVTVEFEERCNGK